MRRLLPVLSLIVLMVPSPALAAEVTMDVPIPVIAGASDAPVPTPTPAPMSCSGTAPQDFHCERTMTLENSFSIRFGLATNYRGAFVIHGFSPTGSTTVWCLMPFVTPPNCPVSYSGVYFEGDPWTMEVLAPAFGYWQVSVS